MENREGSILRSKHFTDFEVYYLWIPRTLFCESFALCSTLRICSYVWVSADVLQIGPHEMNWVSIKCGQLSKTSVWSASVEVNKESVAEAGQLPFLPNNI